MGGVGLGVVGTLALGVYILTLLPETPDAYRLARATQAQPSLVLAADGTKLTQFEPPFREWVPLDSIPQPLVDALIVTEDRRFYRHGGIDVWRTVRAAWNSARGRREGGSTITQQLARNLFPERIGREGSLRRKLKEGIAAVIIEREHTKREILEAYLNTASFLYNAHGVEMAARTYFGRHARELTVPQAATLVAMLKGPSGYNPVRRPERALARRNLVIGLMAEAGDITPAEAARYRREPLGAELRPQPGTASRAPHFTRRVRSEVEAWAVPRGYDIEQDGLVIHTTLDPDLQRAAEAAVREVTEGLQAVADVEWSTARLPWLGTSTKPYERVRSRRDPFAYFWRTRREVVRDHLRRTDTFLQLRDQGLPPDAAEAQLRRDVALMDSVKRAATRLEAGLVAIDPATGAVRAYVGSRDFGESEYDHAGVALRQPGSTFKPFVFAAALQRGYLPDDLVVDAPPSAEPAPDLFSWNRETREAAGPTVTLRDALAYSKNDVTRRLVGEMGPARVARMARQLGVTSEMDVVPSIGLGTSAVTVLEMTAAYATLANEGRRREPRFVQRIESGSSGRTLTTFEPEGGQVITGRDAQMLVDMMRGVVDYGTGTAVRTLGVTGDVAGKTGTTQHGADGWFLLMHPRLVTGAWVGFDDQRVRFRSDHWGYGSSNALPVAATFVRSVQDRLGEARFAEPPRLGPPLTAENDSDTLFTPRPDSLDVLPDTAGVGGWRVPADPDRDPLRRSRSARWSDSSTNEPRAEREYEPARLGGDGPDASPEPDAARPRLRAPDREALPPDSSG